MKKSFLSVVVAVSLSTTPFMTSAQFVGLVQDTQVVKEAPITVAPVVVNDTITVQDDLVRLEAELQCREEQTVRIYDKAQFSIF